MRKLPNGLRYGLDKSGKRICVGAQMGRPDRLPYDLAAPIKFHLTKLKWVDGDYDRGGAYWGRCYGANDMSIWWAFADLVIFEGPEAVEGRYHSEMFVRCKTRAEAKVLVRHRIPNAKFYR